MTSASGTDAGSKVEFSYHLDSFGRHDRVIKVRGWTELQGDGQSLGVTLAGVSGQTISVSRADLTKYYVPNSINWGFDSVIVFPDNESARLACLGPLCLHSSRGSTIVDNQALLSSMEQPVASMEDAIAVPIADRKSLITKYVRKGSEGIEIGPYHSPLLSKLAGDQVLVMDVFDTKKLKERAAKDPYLNSELISHIEDVDIVGSCDNIEELVEKTGKIGKISFVLSSHNFEHLPNPIKFLQGCHSILQSEGFVSMAVPDYRCCFDYFRPFSTTADFIRAYLSSDTRPTAYQHFVMNSLHSRYNRDGFIVASYSIDEDPSKIVPMETLKQAMDAWLRAEKGQDATYHDAHCWAMTPSSLHLILADLQFLGLLPFDIVEISPTNGHEFYVHLRSRKDHAAPALDSESFYEKRKKLLFQAKDEEAATSPAFYSMKNENSLLKTQLDGVRRALAQTRGGP